MARGKQAIINEYRRNRRRIQSTIYRYRKQGLEVNFELPKIPKNITAASVRRLEKITPKTIQEKTRGVDYSTGEIVSYFRAKKILNKKSELPFYDGPAFAADIIINNFKINMSAYNEHANKIIISWLDGLIGRFGANEVASMLDRAQDEGKIPDYSVMYKEQLLRHGLAEMVQLMDISQLEKDKLADYVEYEENFDM